MKPRSAAQIAGDRKRCLNGVCKMTPEERKVRKRKYHAEVLEDPFRRAQYAAYFRKRRARHGMREGILRRQERAVAVGRRKDAGRRHLHGHRVGHERRRT